LRIGRRLRYRVRGLRRELPGCHQLAYLVLERNGRRGELLDEREMLGAQQPDIADVEADDQPGPAGPPPEPYGAGTVRELTERLPLLRAWAGLSYRAIHQEVLRSRRARGVVEQPALNAVYRCLQPDRDRLDAELVVDIAQALLGDPAAAQAWRHARRVVAAGRARPGSSMSSTRSPRIWPVSSAADAN
jgi:hypothetical protein